MRLSAVAFIMILTTVFLSGCGKTEMASVEDHGGQFYGRNAGVAATPTHGVYRNATVAANAETMTVDTRELAAPGAATTSGWQWPVEGKITQNFGKKENGVVNEGIVIEAAEGAPIHAAQAGVVAFVGQDTKNYGNMVILRHADGDMTSYAHAQSIAVKKGDRVVRGGVIAYVGHSGNAKVPQLHFAVREGNNSIDPLSKLPQQLAMR